MLTGSYFFFTRILFYLFLILTIGFRQDEQLDRRRSLERSASYKLLTIQCGSRNRVLGINLPSVSVNLSQHKRSCFSLLGLTLRVAAPVPPPPPLPVTPCILRFLELFYAFIIPRHRHTVYPHGVKQRKLPISSYLCCLH